MPSLYEPIKIGAIECKNRVIMGPLTRGRATHIKEGALANKALMAEYYSQRAGAGLIISEAIPISAQGCGWPYTPGLWSSAQVESWKPITSAVHAAGGKIIAQLWHMGRRVHPNVSGEQVVVAPSALPFTNPIQTYEGKKDPVPPHALTVPEIHAVVQDYSKAATNAIEAGFDGVQVHGANGYLIDQFLKERTNQRTDEYGGTPEKRTRFMREVLEAVSTAIGTDRVGIRLSPTAPARGIDEVIFDEPNPESVFLPAAAIVEELKIPHLELREPGPNGTFGASHFPKLHGPIRQIYKSGVLILNQDYTREQAETEVQDGTADAICFGRAFISNPDLVKRLQNKLELTPWDDKTFYTQGPEGLIDYSFATS